MAASVVSGRSFGEGYEADKPDNKDKLYAYELYYHMAETGVQLQAQQVKPDLANYHQRDLGSCVANAVAMALRYAEARAADNSEKNKYYRTYDPSRLFIWYQAKKLDDEKDVKFNFGCGIRNAIKAVRTLGVPPDREWPYPTVDTYGSDDGDDAPLPERLCVPPPPAMLESAKKYPILDFAYYRIKTKKENDPAIPKHDDGTIDPPSGEISRVVQMRECLARNCPIIFGIGTYWKPKDETKPREKWGDWELFWRPMSSANYESRTMKAPDGTQNAELFLKPSPKGNPKKSYARRGGHAMIITGYHRDYKAFRVQNSWGFTPGNPDEQKNELPHFWIPYSYFDPAKDDELEFVNDIWVIMRKEETRAKK